MAFRCPDCCCPPLARAVASANPPMCLAALLDRGADIGVHRSAEKHPLFGPVLRLSPLFIGFIGVSESSIIEFGDVEPQGVGSP